MGKVAFIISIGMMLLLLAAIFAIRFFLYQVGQEPVGDLLLVAAFVAVVVGLPLMWLSYFEENVDLKP